MTGNHMICNSFRNKSSEMGDIWLSFIYIFVAKISPNRVKQSCLYLLQSRLDSSSQRIMRRIIKELTYKETVELDGSPCSMSVVDFSHNCSRTQNIFTQNVYFIKDVINVSWLSGWDTFKTCMIFGVVESWAGMLQIKPAISKNVHLSRPRRLLRIHFQLTD